MLCSNQLSYIAKLDVKRVPLKWRVLCQLIPYGQDLTNAGYIKLFRAIRLLSDNMAHQQLVVEKR